MFPRIATKFRVILFCLNGSAIIWILVVLAPTVRLPKFEIPLVEDSLPGGQRKTELLLDAKPIFIPHLNQTKTFLLILVLSAPAHFKSRKAIRETWANRSWTIGNYRHATTFEAFFLLGQSTLTESIRHEHELYNDIILGAFEDSYGHLVTKVFFGLNWALRGIQFEYLIKCDDDVYMNIPRLVKWLQSERSALPRNLYGGYMHKGVKPIRKDYKNALSKAEYPGNVFPPYAAGPAYILSQSSVNLILKASHIMKPFFVEDAFMGCLARHAGIKPYEVKGFSFSYNWTNKVLNCSPCDLFVVYIFGHNFSSDHMVQMHTKVLEFEMDTATANLLCIQYQLLIVCKIIVIATPAVVLAGLLVYFLKPRICRNHYIRKLKGIEQ